MLRMLNAALSRFEETLIGTLLITASIILFVNVVGRYGFNTGISWAEELVRYEIVWMVFVGASVAARKGVHIGVDALVRLLPEPTQRGVAILVNIICVAFCVFLVVYGGYLVAQTRSFGQLTPALQMPFWIVQLGIPVGGLLMGIRFVQRLIVELRGGHEQATIEILG